MLGELKRDRVAERREAARSEILEAAWAVARERGLVNLTLRDVAERVGMRAPSLYSHFESKNAIFDALFAQAWGDCLGEMTALMPGLPSSPRAALRRLAVAYFDFSVEDLARYQLMNQRVISDFEPSPAAYAPSVATLQALTDAFASLGIRKGADVDLYVALVGGLINAQLANDRGGTRWRRLLNRTIDMYADNLGL